MGPGHPECPERLDAIEDRLLVTGVGDALERFEAPEAALADIELAHDRMHVAALRGMSDRLNEELMAGGPNYAQLDTDTSINAHTWKAALRAAGAALAATDAVMAGRAGKRLLRGAPPGPPCHPQQGHGFCFFNNVAVAAKYALQRYNLHRVAVVDFDVHHGMAPRTSWRATPRALMVSIFQHPFYPLQRRRRSGAQHGQCARGGVHPGHGHPRNHRDDVDSEAGGVQARDDFRECGL